MKKNAEKYPSESCKGSSAKYTKYRTNSVGNKVGTSTAEEVNDKEVEDKDKEDSDDDNDKERS
eukprot:gene12475-15682_t